MEDKRVIQAGYYEGSVEDYGISNNSKGDLQAFIKFKIKKDDGEGFVSLTWFGGLSEKIAPGKDKSPASWTIHTLLDCGFKGQEAEDLAGGITSGVIDPGREMALTVQDNTYNDKLTSRIAWVNIIGSGGGQKNLSKEELTGKINSSSLRAMLLKERQNRPSDDTLKGIGF
jgi:hypothetical protein